MWFRHARYREVTLQENRSVPHCPSTVSYLTKILRCIEKWGEIAPRNLNKRRFNAEHKQCVSENSCEEALSQARARSTWCWPSKPLLGWVASAACTPERTGRALSAPSGCVLSLQWAWNPILQDSGFIGQKDKSQRRHCWRGGGAGEEGFGQF